MNRFVALAVLCLFTNAPADAARRSPQQHESPPHGQSPYRGEESREIKALSPAEITGYRRAHGMGFAKVAELNHYPGPKHVLELAEELELSAGQIELTRQAFDVMREEASALGEELIRLERRLDALFAEGSAAAHEVHALIGEIAATRGEIRFAHVRAHIAMKSILSPEQVARYDELRGYAR